MSRTLGIEEPPATKPQRKIITEALMSELAGISSPAFRDLVRKLRGLDEAAQANLLLNAIELRNQQGDTEGARRLMVVFASLFPHFAENKA